MADGSGIEPGYDLDDSDGSVDLSGWTNCQDSESHQKRSEIFHEIIEKHCLDQLRTIVESGWEVNEELTGYDPPEPLLYLIIHSMKNQQVLKMVQLLLEHGANPNVAHSVNIGSYGDEKWVKRTALQEAARVGCTELVKLLLDAGAKCTTSEGLQNPLALAIQKFTRRPPDLIELLLKHAADPNDHDGQPEHIPLLKAIGKCENGGQNDTTIVQLLLEHGADPHISYRVMVRAYQQELVDKAARRGLVKILLDAGTTYILEKPLAIALRNRNCPADLVELLLKRGADVNCMVNWDIPLLHRLAQYTIHAQYMFLHQQLDLVFLHGGNISKDDAEDRTALECVARIAGHINSVRWLIRHGADTGLKFTLQFMMDRKTYFPGTPLILLQAGMRVSHVAPSHLSNMEAVITTWLQENPVDEDGYDDSDMDDEDISRTIQVIWDQLEEAEEEELQRAQFKLKKYSFPEYWTRQMVDLQEFSDDSLQVYPENAEISYSWHTRYKYQNMLDLIHKVLEFVSQRQSLQWHCRRCVRENLVSLQPSVVKALPIPAKLKRYILCHEI